MKFIYLDKDGNQVGPVDESIIIQEIRAGRLTAQTPMRNALLKGFRTVAEFEQFAQELGSGGNPADADNGASGRSAWQFLQKAIAQKEAEQSNSVSDKFTPGDAPFSRRVMAMIFDAAILIPVLIFIFAAFLPGLKHIGKQNVEELERQQKAYELFQRISSAKQAQRKPQLPGNAETSGKINQEQEKTGDTAAQAHSTRRAMLDRVIPNAMKKLDQATAKHQAEVQQATEESPALTSHQSAARRTRLVGEKESRLQQDFQSDESPDVPGFAVEPEEKQQKKEKAAYLLLPRKDRPKALLRNMPGAHWVKKLFPSLVPQWENRLYTVPPAAAAQGSPNSRLPVPDFLLTGCWADDDGLLLRIGGEIRRTTVGELQQYLMRPLVLSSLALLLYYTLCFSIFAQTFGMWFWGTFLTRSKVSEVLPFRAVIYTLIMLLTGVLMIPMVLISRRSLADWLCGVRQICVGSVSKSANH